ncbi:2-C-methyl-D-erythritol 2,4-cyclodiphosphate synthase [candidate division WOR-1 bacterium RIFOXYA12_FULL_43_27]|uniref:2-C-methyl-D-erythritol 2,4-cyclodiphosphate synthase n=1 Tax=candidate division WOR-1 bacterium RIFOXYC2_FULL_46_14 TaxID=1802587 RepID=A0A1F4U5I0_UNCSA|nr:MAG: 2-C-methyl-D-erythritol 2,4-cyclodiphosphate synthase [candidate division WOR-1 bacterium RIFOXYA12_FULL_43_27]OGC20389.1 MAG: 2-C-methyl-D-erythritol 2,4-cyclodiphosphate synthase [candidate division WOR-1 bacterium RIFOXYB2_FULL_46_45]OGC31874.1 MAG: 2-C-methyl-D-erythritol 2,4-cyclodiphosphate synthase [candidate division WOR-1 bacterium RIFOXYA2_FULL_46_56]OGC40235.1 MAG: 2-C-methyl-D-erythritol 2,4-cyclodiphosphate synthase [candidate division WOR-1 bacterium RIFOXYC2_FULL_46_14]
MRVGIGYDVHKLRKGRKLILGGVEIPFEKGLLGHSDADVLVHAVIDAILGALSAGCIGEHFPDTDPQYKGISSMKLLEKITELIELKESSINNIDATIVCQKPKLTPYFREMKESIAKALTIDPDQVNIKAKTEEGLGFTGKGQGISAYAICLAHKKV